ncbi:serum deprivation-response protein-like [Scleropages formosus]|uniref:Caveolae associated protein 2b n=1 Tax=Scleropages formosus TaxID=113540 RepID=A0A0P7YDX7_SCLFO|nr:caveolae-associated protein 2-like [Scleropages formosus]KPP64533.1 serum deprivation-response protein-like [Scleropages formosus]
MGEDAVQAERSGRVSGHEEQELVVPSPSRSSHSHHSLHWTERIPAGQAMAEMKESSTGEQVNAITVLTLLDKLVNMLDTVQESQHKMEQKQLEMESAVCGIQSDMAKLSKSHTSTTNTVSKLLEKSQKISIHMKEVKNKMDQQAMQVKKLEANHGHLVKRNNFKVLIFQEEKEIPSSAFTKDPVPYPHEAEEGTSTVDVNCSQDEGLQTINLSSDEDLGPNEDYDESGKQQENEGFEKSRTEKIKYSSLKKVDSLKKAFSRQNIEKKINKISTKIVSPEKREKLKKSFVHNYPKNSSDKSSSFKSSSAASSVKKEQDGKGSPEPEGSLKEMASISLAPISSPDEDLPFNEVHSNLAPAVEEAKGRSGSLGKEEEDIEEGELSIAEDENPGYTKSAPLPQEDRLPTLPSTLQQQNQKEEPEDDDNEFLNLKKMEAEDEPEVLFVE